MNWTRGTLRFALGLVVLCPTQPRPSQTSESPRVEGERIGYAPEKGIVVEKRFDVAYHRTLETIFIKTPQEEREEKRAERVEGTTTIVVRDTYRSQYPDSPFRIDRVFQTLVDRARLVNAEHEVEVDRASPFDGKSVKLEWDLKTADIEASFLGDDEPSDNDRILLKGLAFDIDFLSLLPPKVVVVGDQWKVRFDKFKWNVLRPGGHLAWQSDPPDPTAEWVSWHVWKELTGDIEAEYLRKDETQDHHTLVVIGFNGRLESMADIEIPRDTPGSWPSAAQMDHEITGELEWDLDRGLPHALTMTRQGLYVEVLTVLGDPKNRGVTIEGRWSEAVDLKVVFD